MQQASMVGTHPWETTVMEDALLVNGGAGPALRGWRSTAPGLLDVSPPGRSLPLLCALALTCSCTHALVSDSQISQTTWSCRMHWLSAKASHVYMHHMVLSM